jgi:hypothetical protein
MVAIPYFLLLLQQVVAVAAKGGMAPQVVRVNPAARAVAADQGQLVAPQAQGPPVKETMVVPAKRLALEPAPVAALAQ